VAYCEIIDTIHPKSIPNKGGFKGRSEYEYINNFKLLQQCFTKLGIYKNIEI
jgi:RP/EB family microtubule-associated protein